MKDGFNLTQEIKLLFLTTILLLSLSGFLWYLTWTFVLKVNPTVRDLLYLDPVKKKSADFSEKSAEKRSPVEPNSSIYTKPIDLKKTK
jgi:hypothetical protein